MKTFAASHPKQEQVTAQVSDYKEAEQPKINLEVPKNKPEEKPREYYSKALELIGNNEDYADQKKGALTYLMVYYLKKEDDAKCKVYVNEILKIDPNNALAKKVQTVLK